MKKKFDVRFGLLRLDYLAVYDTGSILRYWENGPLDKVSHREKNEIRRRRGSLQTMLGRYIEKRRCAKFRELGKRVDHDQLPADLNPLYRPLLTLSFAGNKRRHLWSGAQLIFLAAEDVADPRHPCKYDLRGTMVLHNYIRDYLEEQGTDRLFSVNDPDGLPLKVPAPSARFNDAAALPSPETHVVSDSAAMPRDETHTPFVPATNPTAAASQADDAVASVDGRDQPIRFPRKPKVRFLLRHFRRPAVTFLIGMVMLLVFVNMGTINGWQKGRQTWWRQRLLVKPEPVDDFDFDALDQLALYLWGQAQRRAVTTTELEVIAAPLTASRWLSDQSRALLILSQAAFMRGDYETSARLAQRAQPLFPEMKTPMPNDHRLAFIVEGNARLFLGDRAAARRALAAARRLGGSHADLVAAGHLESLLHFCEGRRGQAVATLYRILPFTRDDDGVTVRNTLALFLAVNDDLAESAAMRLQARFLNQTVRNEFETSRNLLAEWVWTLQQNGDGPTTHHLVPQDDPVFEGNLRLLAPYFQPTHLGERHGNFNQRTGQRAALPDPGDRRDD